MLKTLTTLFAYLTIIGVLSSPVVAQTTISDEEKELCLEAINDLTDGKPPATAKKLCDEGKTEKALEVALSAQEGWF